MIVLGNAIGQLSWYPQPLSFLRALSYASLDSCYMVYCGHSIPAFSFCQERKRKKKIHKHLFLWEEELQRKLLSGRHLSIASLKLPPYYWPYLKKKRIKTRKAFMSYM